MPLFYQQDINLTTKLGVWKIEESEDFFLLSVPLQRTITHPHKRLQHLAGRYLLPFLFPDFPHEEIEIADTRKPFLPDEQYHFSISHCGDYAAAIVSSTERVGIDIEMITPRVDRIKHKLLHEDEFSEAMRTFSFKMNAIGMIDGLFEKEEFNSSVKLNYEMREDLSLVWLHTPVE